MKKEGTVYFIFSAAKATKENGRRLHSNTEKAKG
jgi:hypothetical protein